MRNLGVNVIEVDGRTPPTIVAAPISTPGFLVRSERGVPNVPVLVRGFADFVTAFGGYTDFAFGAHALAGFFSNGGSEAYVSRIVGASPDTAAVTLNDRAAAPALTLSVQAGRLGRADPGAWGNALAVRIEDHPRGSSAIPAQIVGASGTVEPFPLMDLQTLVLTVTVGGVDRAETVTFHTADFATIGTAAASEVAATINRGTTLVRAGVTADRRLVLASALTGSAARSRLQVGGTAAAILGFTGGTVNSDSTLAAGANLILLESVGGLLPGAAVRLELRGRMFARADMATSITDGAGIDVTVDGGTAQTITFRASDFLNGVASITPGEVMAAINRQAQGFTAVLAPNSRLLLLSNTYGLTPSGVASSIAVTNPGGATPPGMTALGLTATAPTIANGVREYRELATVSDGYKLVTLTTALPAFTPFPTDAVLAAARIQSVEFDVVVIRRETPPIEIELERDESLSRQPGLTYSADAVINNENAGSRYIRVIPDTSNTTPGRNAPAPGSFRLGTTVAGDDGADPADTAYIGDPLQRTGLYAFTDLPIQLLATPETTAQGVVAAALAYCENRGDAMFVGVAPRGFDLDAAITYASVLRGRKVYGALYYPWIQIVNPRDLMGNTPRIFVPPVGHILGMYARVGETRGVWKAPAGDEAQLANALAVETELTDRDHTHLVKDGAVNGVRAIPGVGVVVDSSRTLSSDTRWLYVNVRRLFNFVKSSLREGLRWVAQEPHDENLRRAVRFNVIEPFLLGLWRQGAFGSDAASDTFTVKCDAENNPPSQVTLGNFRIEVFFYPVRPVETIILIVGQQESGASATES